jgi:tetratricopeptide (TPR) repeat protein
MSPEFWPDFNDLWDYSDPAATEEKFRALLPGAAAGEDRSYSLQLLTQIARTLGLQRKFTEAGEILDQVEAQMEQEAIVEVRCLLERGRVLNSSKQPEQALPLFKRAAEIAEQIGADFYAADALHMLGIAAPAAERLEWNLKAIAYADRSAQPRARHWLGPLYNNTGWTLFDEGRFEEALDQFQKAQAFREEQGQEEQVRIAMWCVARTLRALNRVEQALNILWELVARGQLDGFTEEEIGECMLAQGRAGEARPYFKAAYEKLSQIDWVAEDVERMDRLKTLGGQ